MWETFTNELSAASHEIVRSLGSFLPRLLVTLVIIVVGWLIAALLRMLLRSFLRLIRFDLDVGKHGDTGTSEVEVLRAVAGGQADGGGDRRSVLGARPRGRAGRCREGEGDLDLSGVLSLQLHGPGG